MDSWIPIIPWSIFSLVDDYFLFLFLSFFPRTKVIIPYIGGRDNWNPISKWRLYSCCKWLLDRKRRWWRFQSHTLRQQWCTTNDRGFQSSINHRWRRSWGCYKGMCNICRFACCLLWFGNSIQPCWQRFGHRFRWSCYGRQSLWNGQSWCCVFTWHWYWGRRSQWNWNCALGSVWLKWMWLCRSVSTLTCILQGLFLFSSLETCLILNVLRCCLTRHVSHINILHLIIFNNNNWRFLGILFSSVLVIFSYLANQKKENSVRLFHNLILINNMQLCNDLHTFLDNAWSVDQLSPAIFAGRTDSLMKKNKQNEKKI